MVFIRLVSAVEVLSQHLTLDHKDDRLEEQEINSLIGQSNLSDENKRELKTVFDVRKSRKKFIRFVEQHCGGFFRGGDVEAKRLKIKRADLAKPLNAIYTSRSKYLHAGEPMFLSQPFRGSAKWDTDPTTGMVVDNRTFSEGQKLPYAWFFEGLVRQCLLNYLKWNALPLSGGSMSEQIFAFGSNMCSGSFRAYKVSPLGPGCPAVLSGYRLAFNKKSTEDLSGKANVTAREDSEVWGVLYAISSAD